MALITKLRSVVKGPPLLFLDHQPIAGWRKSDFEYTRALTAGAGADWRTSVRLAPAEPCRCPWCAGNFEFAHGSSPCTKQACMHRPHDQQEAGGTHDAQSRSQSVPTCHLPALGNGGMNCTSAGFSLGTILTED